MRRILMAPVNITVAYWHWAVSRGGKWGKGLALGVPAVAIILFVAGLAGGSEKEAEDSVPQPTQAAVVTIASTVEPSPVSTAVPPTETPQPTETPALAAEPTVAIVIPTEPPPPPAQPPAGTCCKVCGDSKACGDSCISPDKNCTKPPGCACDG